jgi:8-oxo-dGTP pyrophosphatase MutT (NUDIX family)
MSYALLASPHEIPAFPEKSRFPKTSAAGYDGNMASVTDGIIPQATAIPYRWRDGMLEFCLITSAQKAHWAFPKGVIDPGDTEAGTALKEAHEEAGLSGTILGEALGSYRYAKWGRELHVTVRLMRVTAVADHWDEVARRDRRWATAEEARRLIDRAELRQLLDVAIERIERLGLR